MANCGYDYFSAIVFIKAMVFNPNFYLGDLVGILVFGDGVSSAIYGDSFMFDGDYFTFRVRFNHGGVISLHYFIVNCVGSVNSIFSNKNLFPVIVMLQDYGERVESRMPFLLGKEVSNQSNFSRYRFSVVTVNMGVVILRETKRFVSSVLVNLNVGAVIEDCNTLYRDGVGFSFIVASCNAMAGAMVNLLVVAHSVHFSGNH